MSLQLTAMRDVSATEAAVINALEPLWGAAFAWFALGERWGLRGWIGASFILGGSLVTQVWGSPEPPPVNSAHQIPKEEQEFAQKYRKIRRDGMGIKQRSTTSRRN